MLDEDDGITVGGQPPDDLQQFVFLPRIHACRRLVQQKKLRLRGQGPGDLQTALHAVGQIPRLPVPHLRNTDVVHAVGHDIAAAGFFLPLLFAVDDGVKQSCAGPAVARDQDILRHGHAAEQPDVLEGAADTELRDLFRLLLRDVLSLKPDAPRGTRGDARQKVVEGGLPGAVRPDDRYDLTAVDAEIDLLVRDDAAEMLGKLFCLKQYLTHTGLLLPHSFSPRMPSGRNRMIRISIRP